MRLPWISRGLHDEMVELLRAHLAELTEDRKRLLDRLASIGLGGPIYQLSAVEAAEGEAAEAEEVADPEADFIEKLMRLRHRPAKLADALTRKAYREYGKRTAGPKVAWIPQAEKVKAALDEAEALGRG